MDNNIDSLKSFIEKIKIIGFWGRIFGWGSVRRQMVDAATDLQKVLSNFDALKEQNATLQTTISQQVAELKIANDNVIRKDSEIDKLNFIIGENNAKISSLTVSLSSSDTTLKNQLESIARLTNENTVLAENNTNLSRENKRLSGEAASNTEIILNHTNRKGELEAELAGIKMKLAGVEEDLKNTRHEYIQLAANEENRKEKYENDVTSLNAIREQIQGDRNREVEERNTAENLKIRNLKETWSKHQENVKNVLKNICNKHTIEYVEKVSFRGEPDNTLKICDELVIFDAKSPGSDDLNNFPSYLKAQSESAKKYAKQENVKSDIFFVVPSNTLERLSTFVFNLGDYNVFIISIDSLEQVILTLKKIEEYEFAEQLSPEERENICRVLGKFAHLTKRRIQIDSFFAKQFIELAYKSESDLPKEIFDKVVEFEKSEKLNPPIEKRAKAINVKELEKDILQINNEAFSKGIVSDDANMSDGINKLQLYKPETE